MVGEEEEVRAYLSDQLQPPNLCQVAGNHDPGLTL